MKVGVIAIQGYFGEYEGWEPARAAEHMLVHARRADELGFESVWVFDHFTPESAPDQAFMLESFISAAAIARETRRIRIGHLVACASFRNAALTAKMASSLDVLSGGRYELGLGAGWKEDEWRSYGYGFPSLRARLAALEGALISVRPMLAATDDSGASSMPLNEPRGLQSPRIPLIVGGNGPRTTWRLAARHADELNVDGLAPTELEVAKPVIASHCRAAHRDPSSLRLSVNVRADALWTHPDSAMSRHHAVTLLRQYAAAGISRVQVRVPISADSGRGLERLAEVCAVAGFEGG